jgi:endonuclease I
MRSSLLRLTPVVAALVLVLLMLKEVGVSQARGGVGPIPGNTTIQSFNKAKKLRQQVYAGHEEEYYCGCRFSGNIVDIKAVAMSPRRA